VTTVADRTHYCADHPDAELTQVHGSVGACVECPQCHRRICQGCNEVASECWSSGLCHGCYREASRRWEADKRQRELAAEYNRGRAEQAAADRERVEAACAKAEVLTQEAMGHRSKHWRGIDYADGLDSGIETTTGLVRAALDSEGGA
jgi:hypothetical protein